MACYFLPVKYRFDLFVTSIALPVAGLIFLVASSFLFPHFDKNKRPGLAMSAVIIDAYIPRPEGYGLSKGDTKVVCGSVSNHPTKSLVDEA